MSGWFGTSNRETNTPLSGIAAGHRGRRNHQKQRYKSMGRMTIDQMAQQNRVGDDPMTPPGNIQEYRGHKLESTFNAGINKWVTKGSMGLMFFTGVGRSKGESVNAVKTKIDTSLGIVEKQTAIFTDASASTTDTTLPVTDPGEVARFNRLKAQEEARKMFTPVTMPRDFTTGRYTVRAMYNGMSRKYTVSVFEGTVVKEVATFTQDQGAAAVVKHTQFKSLATKKTVYEGKKPLSVAKTNYDVKLQVTTAAAGLSGFFNGIMNMFGLGLTVDQIAEQNRVGPKPDFQTASNASVTTDYTSASNRPEVSAKWSEMPAKSFKVITSRKDGTVVKESGSTSDYLRAVDMFQAEVATIENTPDFYDQDAPLVPEVPTNNGNGGDITSSGVTPFVPPSTHRRISYTPEFYKGYHIKAAMYGHLRESYPRHVIEVAEVYKDSTRKELRINPLKIFKNETELEAYYSPYPDMARMAAKAWVDANPLIQENQLLKTHQNDGPGSLYRDPIMTAADEKKKRDAAKAKLAEADRFGRRKEQEARRAAQAKAAAAKARADREAAQDYLRQESARAAEEKAAADARAAEQKASEAAAAEAQAKADALKFLQQDASVVTTDTTTVYEDQIIRQAQTGSENYNELVNAGEDTTTFYQDPIITQAQNRSAQMYVAQNYEANPYIIQQATADNATFKQPEMTSNQTMGLALVGLAGLAYVANRK